MTRDPINVNPYEAPKEAGYVSPNVELTQKEIARRLRPPLIAVAIIAAASLLFDIVIIVDPIWRLITNPADPTPITPESIVLFAILIARAVAMLRWSIRALRGAIMPSARRAAIVTLIPCSTFLILVEWPIGLWLWIELSRSVTRRSTSL